MGLGAILEPLVVVSLLFGGTYVNRDRSVYPRGFGAKSHAAARSRSSSISSPDSEAAFLPPVGDDISRWRTRRISILGWSREVTTPNTAVYADTALSRLLKKFPFLAEAWYWALIYWVYQLGRAATAVTLQQDTVDVARTHALELIALEQRLGLFVEPQIQAFFLAHPQLLKWINWLYSFIHIPGTIFFLVFLYHFCITSNRITHQPVEYVGMISASASGPALYEARRRTMATCNLLAFIVFTLWPCMPPRLLSDPEVQGEVGELARSFGFVDTVHSKEGASSVWTQNKFCNQYAAMPSLHFGYSLLVGLTIATLPLEPSSSRRGLLSLPLLGRRRFGRRRALCLLVGFLYPFSILTAIVSTANHFILDAVAGACVCALGWYSNGFLLNLLPLEDYFLSLVRIHKPQYPVVGDTASSPTSSTTLFMADGDDDNEKASLPK